MLRVLVAGFNMRFFCLIGLVLFINSCKKAVNHQLTINNIDVPEFKADSLNEQFLKKSVYDTALFYNNSPITNESFFLNEKVLIFGLSSLSKSFTKKEQSKPIPIKEVTWQLNSIDLITVWYAKRDSLYKPVHTLIFNRSIEY